MINLAIPIIFELFCFDYIVSNTFSDGYVHLVIKVDFLTAYMQVLSFWPNGISYVPASKGEFF